MNKSNANPTKTMQDISISQPPRASLVRKFASRLGVDADKLMSTLKDTAFKQPFKDGKPGPEVTDAQMMALLVVANEYGLNPFLKEIYAFPAKGGGIVPMVSLDGWVRIVNSRPELEWFEFDYAPPGSPRDEYWVSCTMKRKDREKPVTVTEYFSECYRNTDPWNNTGRRMNRHRAFIQCARMVFGFGGIYDPDEAERIADAMAIDVTPSTTSTKPITRAPRERLEHQPARTVEPPLTTRAAEPVEAERESQEDFVSLASEPGYEDEAGARG